MRAHLGEMDAAMRSEMRWSARPLLAWLVRVLVFIVPVAAGVAVAMLVARAWTPPPGIAGDVVWVLGLVVVSVAPTLALGVIARRFLPLARLLELTLIFPDDAPSRIEVAKKAGRTKDLMVAVAQARSVGVRDDPTRTAEEVLTLITSLGAHDRVTRGHSERTRVFVDLLADEIGLDDLDRTKLRWAALLHDIGKLEVPTEILNKPGRPTETEWAVLREHPIQGARIAAPLAPFLGSWVDAVEHHHEHWDGSGYPHGLAGENISLGARILAIADAYEVITAARSYKRALTPARARAELAAGAGRHFDPHLVRAFMNVSLHKLWRAVGAAALIVQIPLLAWLARGPLRRLGSEARLAATSAGTVLSLAAAGIGVGVPPVEPVPRAGPAPVPVEIPKADVEATDAPDRPVTDRVASARPVRRDDGGGAAAAAPPSTAPEREGAGPAPEGTPEPPPESGGKDRPAPERRETYSGRIRGSNRLDALGPGATEREFATRCAMPATQGVDAYVFEVPEAFSTGDARAEIAGDGALAHDLAARFYSSRCEVVGSLDTAGADEEGPVPQGTRYAVVEERNGADTSVTLSLIVSESVT